MYINPYEFFYGDGGINIQYISEVVHAKQFGTPVRWVDVCVDIVRSFIKAGFNCEKAYSYMIGKPGFYEYDAHEVSEPALEEKLMPSMRVENKELE